MFDLTLNHGGVHLKQPLFTHTGKAVKQFSTEGWSIRNHVFYFDSFCSILDASLYFEVVFLCSALFMTITPTQH